MASIYLVRHGEPAALWGAHPDPGLSELGHKQARHVGANLAGLGIGHVMTSPLARCRETAMPFAAHVGRDAEINSAVAEIPVPSHIEDHRTWLTAIMNGSWRDSHVDHSLHDWRSAIGQTLLGLTQDTVVFTHFVAINVAVGLATNADAVMSFKPGHASVTTLTNSSGQLLVVALGEESAIQLA